jgi:PhnB protein
MRCLFCNLCKNYLVQKLRKNISVDESETTVMHAELKIGNASIMCAEATDQWKTEPAGLFIYVENADASYAKALELGCTSILELTDQPYGRTCGVKDTFGNTWWITSV